MLSDEKKDRLRFLFEQGRLEEFLQESVALQEEGYSIGDYRNLLSRLSQANRDYSLNTISYEEYAREISKIRLGIQEIEKAQRFQVNPTNQNQKNIYEPFTWVSLIFPLAVGAIFVYFFVTLMPGCPELPPPTHYEYSEPLGAFPLPQNFSSFRFSGRDSLGRKAEYIIYLVRGFNWRIGEVAIGENNGETIDICAYLAKNGIAERINSDTLQSIVCFGNTSFEEDLSIPAKYRLSNEEDRASERAEELAKCIQPILRKFTPVWVLNLGKYMEKDIETKYQREIIIIGLVGKENNTIEEEALFNGLLLEHYKRKLLFDIQKYSRVNNGRLPLREYY